MAKPRQRATAGLRPGPRIRWLINLTGAGLWLSGGLWLIYHNFLQRSGPWGPEPDVLEPWWLRLHGVFAFLTLWTLGLLWGAHLVGGWASGRRRGSGPLLFGWLILLVVSGYLLIYASDDGPWAVVSPLHWIAGLALPLAYGLHRWFRRSPD